MPMSDTSSSGRSVASRRRASAVEAAVVTRAPCSSSNSLSISRPSSSSSTTRMRRPASSESWGGDVDAGSSGVAARGWKSGRRTVNVAPSPGGPLVASTVPPCSSTRGRTMASPRPTPPSLPPPAPPPAAPPPPGAAPPPQPYPDGVLARGELHRVGQQVPHHLLQPARVSHHQVFLGGEFGVQAHALGFRGRTHRLHRRLDDARQVYRLGLQPQLAGDDAADVQEIPAEPRPGGGV